jgi:hypothetical protein
MDRECVWGRKLVKFDWTISGWGDRRKCSYEIMSGIAMCAVRDVQREVYLDIVISCNKSYSYTCGSIFCIATFG